MNAGDIIVCLGQSPISAAVASVTSGEVSHAMLVVSVDPVPLVLESVFHCRTVPLGKAVEAHSPVYALSHRMLTRAQRTTIIEHAYALSVPYFAWVDQLTLFSQQTRDVIGQDLSALDTKGYSFLRDFLIGLDRLSQSYWFTEHAPKDLNPVCSWLVAQAYDQIHIRFDRPPDSCSPQDILDYARHTDPWLVMELRK